MNVCDALGVDDVRAMLQTQAEDDLMREAGEVVACARAQELLAQVLSEAEVERLTLASDARSLEVRTSQAGALWTELVDLRTQIPSTAGRARVELTQKAEVVAQALSKIDTTSSPLRSQRLRMLEALADALSAIEKPETPTLATLLDVLK